MVPHDAAFLFRQFTASEHLTEIFCDFHTAIKKLQEKEQKPEKVPATVSYLMSLIRSTETGIEVALRRAIFALCVRTCALLGIVTPFLNSEPFELINIESVFRIYAEPSKNQFGSSLLYLHKNLMH